MDLEALISRVRQHDGDEPPLTFSGSCEHSAATELAPRETQRAVAFKIAALIAAVAWALSQWLVG